MTRHYSGEMDSQITEQNWKKELRAKFGHEYQSGVYIQTTMEAIEPIEDFIQSLITSIKQEERERVISRIDSRLYLSDEIAGVDKRKSMRVYPMKHIPYDEWNDLMKSLTEEDGKEEGK